MFSKTTEYAIRAVIFLSVKTTPQSLIGVNEIAENLNFPPAFLGKVLQDMVRKGLIISVKGPGGGFYLNEKTLDYTILDIVELIEGLGFLDKCGLGINSCNLENPCPIHDQYKSVPEKMRKALSYKTINDIKVDIQSGNDNIHFNF
jgi:Rrf2 family protein